MYIDVYIGNIEGVQRHTRKKKRASCKQAQKLSNWPFGKVKQHLVYKLAPHGIRAVYVSDMSCLPKEKKASSRHFVCRCGYKEHRDVHGARNILSKALHGTFVHWGIQTKMTHLRIA
jgi:putative transposase